MSRFWLLLSTTAAIGQVSAEQHLTSAFAGNARQRDFHVAITPDGQLPFLRSQKAVKNKTTAIMTSRTAGRHDTAYDSLVRVRKRRHAAERSAQSPGGKAQPDVVKDEAPPGSVDDMKDMNKRAGNKSNSDGTKKSTLQWVLPVVTISVIIILLYASYHAFFVALAHREAHRSREIVRAEHADRERQMRRQDAGTETALGGLSQFRASSPQPDKSSLMHTQSCPPVHDSKLTESLASPSQELLPRKEGRGSSADHDSASGASTVPGSQEAPKSMLSSAPVNCHLQRVHLSNSSESAPVNSYTEEPAIKCKTEPATSEPARGGAKTSPRPPRSHAKTEQKVASSLSVSPKSSRNAQLKVPSPRSMDKKRISPRSNEGDRSPRSPRSPVHSGSPRSPPSDAKGREVATPQQASLKAEDKWLESVSNKR